MDISARGAVCPQREDAKRTDRHLYQFNWRPGIGDPTIGGWVTVLLYFLTVISCWKTARNSNLSDWKVWYAISVLLFALGINKQLDLQSALTEVGRVLAYQEGWYANRQTVQLYFIAAVAFVCGWGVIALIVGARRAPLPTWLALLGATFLIAFVLIRAASFHRIDRLITSSIFGFRWNWILEMGGIILVLVASRWRQDQTK